MRCLAIPGLLIAIGVAVSPVASMPSNRRMGRHGSERRSASRWIRRLPRLLLGAGLVLALLAALPSPGPAAAAPPAVGVVTFYAPWPLASEHLDIVPERYVADDLTALLAKAAQGRFTVLPRSSVESAERAVRWETQDVLRYSRLSELAARLHADRLVVGLIRRLEIMTSYMGGLSASSPPRATVIVQRPDGGVEIARATVIVQIFDASRGRLVMATRNSVIVVTHRASEVLDRAVRPAVDPVSAALAGSVP